MKIENENLRLELDPANGDILDLCDKPSAWRVVQRPNLSEGFRLLVPTPDRRANRVSSRRQKAPTVQRRDDDGVTFRWEGVEGEASGPLEIDVEMDIRLTQDAAEFRLRLDNRSPYTIEEVRFPNLGGVAPPDAEPDLEAHTLHLCGGMTRTTLGDGFPMECGYWGTDYPTFLRAYPAPGVHASFELIGNDRRGLYLGVHDPEPNIAVFSHELIPGYLDGKRRRVLRDDDSAGVRVDCARLPHVAPGESVEMAPVILKTYRGTWREGVETYRSWRETWRDERPLPAWAEEVDCWQTIQLDTPEGCVRHRFAELPAIAREAKAAGVGALQVIGWAWDGQDGAEPYQDVNPRLGSAEEFKAAIAECEALGVRILLMGKFKWADRSTEQFREELSGLTLKDAHGGDVYFDGYGYQSLSQMLAGGARRVGAGMCHLAEEYRAIARREFRKAVELGASGFLYDELSNHMLLCYAEDHGHRAGACNTVGSVALAEEFHRDAVAANPDFLLAGEGPNDHLSQFYRVNYIRTWDGCNTGEPIHRAAWKFLDPGMKFATCLAGWDDREMVNQCLALGYIVDFEPFHFKGRLGDFPKTVEYAKKALALRRRLWGFLWMGRYLDMSDEGVRAVDESRQSDLFWSAFEHAASPLRALVAVNENADLSLEIEARPASEGTHWTAHAPEASASWNSAGSETIPPRSLVILAETENRE